jgi:hypothetical protein
MKENQESTHESFGLLQISRASCSAGQNVFGSSIKTANPIRLKICRAVKERSLNREWYYGKENIIEVEMSPTQFAEAITTLNMGSGVPCTIRYVDGVEMAPCPDENINELFNDEFRDDIKNIADTLTELQNKAKEILGKPGSVKKADKELLLGRIYNVEQMVRSNLPFVHTQFTRAMDKTIQQSKAEIEAFVDTATRKIGTATRKIGTVDISFENNEFSDKDLPKRN